MAEYINREDALLKLMQDGCLASSIESIKRVPIADVAPVVYGRWEYNPPTINTYGQLRCSICNWWTLDPSVDNSYSYCPNCGAKMDGGANHETD